MESAPREEQWAVLCFLAGHSIEIDEGELNGALRRAELLLATGGDPRRTLEPDARAVTALAEDLDDPLRRNALEHGLAALLPEAVGLPAICDALRCLLTEPDLAWKAFALSILADALEDSD